MSYAPIHVQYEIEQQVNRIWLESPGIGVKGLMVKLHQLISSSAQISITKQRVKAAKQAIPYRFIPPNSNNVNPNNWNNNDGHGQAVTMPILPVSIAQEQAVALPTPTLTEMQIRFVQQKLEERTSVRSLRRYKDADEIMKGLTAMGIIADDGMRTWTLSIDPIYANTRTPTGNDTHTQTQTHSFSLKDTINTGIPCQSCGRHFASKNLVFRHLRDVSTSCGNVIFAKGQKMPDAPSALKKKEKQEVAKNLRRKKTGRAAQHAAPEATLWFGDLPLPYTRLGGQCKRFRALLREYLPRDVPQPWIKKVVRKGYRQGTMLNESNGDEVCQEQEQRKYLGFAIIVFRDEQEATNVKEALDGCFIDPIKVFTDSPECNDLPEFRLKIKNVEKDTNDNGNANANGNESNEINPSHKIVFGNLDPPLEDQLRPLSIPELQERYEDISRRLEGIGQAFLPRILGEEESSSSQGRNEHTTLLQHTVELYDQLGPRDEVYWKGRAVPEHICKRLLSLLKKVRWPATSHRKGLTSERYLVLQTNVSNDRFYQDLRDGCRELMQSTDPDYYYSGIAVTKNFVASPHIDDRDQSFQYAISLGDFTQGGQLCVEGINSSDGGEKHDFVNVVETHNRIARVDGRHVHWVRTWEKGDRYSLIFYDTTERKKTSIMKSGLDLTFVDESMH